MEAKPAPDASSAACAKVAAKWPATVAKQDSRETTARTDGVRAWGDPAIIARCGVAPPGPTTDECADVNGVDWVTRRLSDGFSFVTYGRTPAIEVLIPTKYESWPIAAFTEAAQQIPQGPRRCS